MTLGFPGSLLGSELVGKTKALDALGVTATGAYSLRLLRAAYTGQCVNIRRSSDNTTKDIGFNGDNFDSATFNTFVGAGNGFVTKWYDQSGGGNDVSQATAAAQPQLQLNQINGRPALTPVAANSQVLTSASTTPWNFNATNFTVLGVINTSTATQICLFSAINGAASDGWSIGTDPRVLFFTANAGTSTFSDNGGTVSLADSKTHLFGAVFTSGNSQNYADGTLQQVNTQTTPSAPNHVLNIFAFGDANGQFYGGSCPEIFIFKSALSTGQLATLRSSVQGYWASV